MSATVRCPGCGLTVTTPTGSVITDCGDHEGTRTDDLEQLLTVGRDARGDHELAVTLLLEGRTDDDDDFGGIITALQQSARRVRVESGIERVIAWVDFARIERAWLTDLSGRTVLEYPLEARP